MDINQNIVLFFNGERGFSVLKKLNNKFNIKKIILGNKKYYKKTKKINNKVIVSKNINTKRIKYLLKKINNPIFIIAGFSQILRGSILKMPSVALNLHAGKLPQYRGGSPLNWQIINNEKYFGLSILKLEKGIDTGPVYLQKKYLLKKKFTIKDLHKVANIEFPKMINHVLLNINKIKPTKQIKKNSKYWKQRNDLDGKINFKSYTGLKIIRLSRALQNPYPNVWCLNNDNFKVRFQKLSITNRKITGLFGTIKQANNKIYLKCKNKNLVINKYKIEGTKKKLSDKEILQ